MTFDASTYIGHRTPKEHAKSPVRVDGTQLVASGDYLKNQRYLRKMYTIRRTEVVVNVVPLNKNDALKQPQSQGENDVRTPVVGAPGKKPLLDYERAKINHTERGVQIFPEFMTFTFNLTGCPQRLLLFILFSEVDKKTMHFAWNKEVRERFTNFCSDISNEKPYDDRTVQEALYELKSKNLAVQVQRGKYFLNPLIAGPVGIQDREMLIKQYAHTLLRNSKDVQASMRPVLKKANTGKAIPKPPSPKNVATNSVEE